MRIAHNQLLVVCSGDAAAPSVGMVRWLGLSEDDILSVGIRVLPGLAKAVPMRAVGLSPTGSPQFVATLLLPNMPSLRSEESLITPVGWYKPGRVVELLQEAQTRRARFDNLLERGPDCERVSFSWI